jgi:hypothetical protein
MLATAAERLRGVNNVRLVKLQQVGLDQMESRPPNAAAPEEFTRI